MTGAPISPIWLAVRVLTYHTHVLIISKDLIG